MSASQPAIEVVGLRKAFRVPKDRPKGSTRTPLFHRSFRRVQLFDGIDFEVAKGEFFGIVGRNGSGKTTLLRVIAGIYSVDQGRVTVNGRIAPVLGLGVGFDPELPTRENAVINSVMLGLSPAEARARTDQIVDFAELEGHSEAKLKHLSSGMKVRLAFSTMIAADPDVLLIDEVLTVGDRGFQEKCAEAMVGLRKRGKTIVLVTHSMSAVEELCSRAMLIDSGKVARIGDPGEIAAAYLEVNLDGEEITAETAEELGSERVSITGAWLCDADSRRRASVEPDETLEIAAALKVARPVPRPTLQVKVSTDRDRGVFSLPAIPILGDDPEVKLEPGDDPELRLRIENRLKPGRYVADLQIMRAGRRVERLPASRSVEIPFEVSGAGVQGRGSIAMRHELSVQAGSGYVPPFAEQLDRAVESVLLPARNA